MLRIVAESMSRDRVFTVINALHVVDVHNESDETKTNALWKV